MTDETTMNPEVVALGNPNLSFSFAERRTLMNFIQTFILWILAGIAAIPLISVLWMLISRGGVRLSLAIFTELPPAPFEQGGGIGNAIVGTLVMVAIGSAISIPIGGAITWRPTGKATTSPWRSPAISRPNGPAVRQPSGGG